MTLISESTERRPARRERPVTDADIEEALKDLDEVMRGLELEYVVIGGVAVAARGQPRYTGDVDVVIAVRSFESQVLVRALTAKGYVPGGWREEAEIFTPMSETEAERVIRDGDFVRFCKGGVPYACIDLTGAFLTLDAESFERATLVPAPKLKVPAASAEDLILYKLLSNRDKDWIDIRTIIARQKALDLDYMKRMYDSTKREIEDPEVEQFTGAWFRFLEMVHRR